MAYIIQISYKKKPEVFYNTGKGTISSKKKALAQAKSWTAYKAKSVAKYRVLSVGEPTVVSQGGTKNASITRVKADNRVSDCLCNPRL